MPNDYKTEQLFRVDVHTSAITQQTPSPLSSQVRSTNHMSYHLMTKHTVTIPLPSTLSARLSHLQSV